MLSPIDAYRTVHDTVGHIWDERAQMSHYWPTPPRVDAIPFGITEINECLEIMQFYLLEGSQAMGRTYDAMLRMKPEYARNNQKEIDMLAELADTMMMLGSSISLVEVEKARTRIEFTARQCLLNRHVDLPRMLASINLSIAQAMQNYYYSSGWACSEEVAIAMTKILYVPGMEGATGLVAGRMARIKAKLQPAP